MKAERHFEGQAVSPVVTCLMRGRERIERCWVNRCPGVENYEECAWSAVGGDHQAADYLFRCLGDSAKSFLAPQSIAYWNDTPGRTKAEVLDLYDRAIAMALNDHA